LLYGLTGSLAGPGTVLLVFERHLVDVVLPEPAALRLRGVFEHMRIYHAGTMTDSFY